MSNRKNNLVFLLILNIKFDSSKMSKIEKNKPYKLTDFDIRATLGTGSYGRVKLCKHKQSQRYFALKMLKKSEIIKHRQTDHVLNQYKILKLVSHPFIINLEEFLQDTRYIYFILEFVQGGDLFTYLRTVGSISPLHSALYSAQVVLAIQYLHSKKIVYRDLKPENILIAEDGYIKLSDFGFAKIVQNRTFTLCGTPEYMAPEILLNQGHGKAVDWWALGVLIYQMNAGIDPFSDDDPLNIYENILKGALRFPKEFPRQVKSLVRHLIIIDLSKRYGNLKNGVQDIKTHKYFSKIDWKMLFTKKSTCYYKPQIKRKDDISNFMSYPDSTKLPLSLNQNQDPFLNW